MSERITDTSTMGERVITTSAGVRIGSAFIPRPPMPSDDAERLQKALLDQKPMQTRSHGLGKWVIGSLLAIAAIYLFTWRS